MKHKYAVKLLLGIFSLLLASQFSFADGSKDLYPAGRVGRRASLVSYNTNGLLYPEAYPFMNRGTQKIYAKKNEKIYIGFSAQGMTATVNGASRLGTIRVFNPSTVPNTARSNSDGDSGTSTTAGRITDRAHELVGPAITGTSSASTGYAPYIYIAPEDGVYEVDFITPGGYGAASASPPSGYSDTNVADGAWTQTASSATIAAWDVTVVANTDPVNLTGTYTNVKPGRVYMNVFNAVAALNSAVNMGFFGRFYIVTKDGFPYQVDNNGMVGGSFTFFVNNRGFTTAADGQGNRTYKSLVGTNPTPFVKDPNEADDADNLNITHKIFYLQPSSDLPETATYHASTTWLKLLNPPDPSATHIKFTGVEGSNSYASTKGAYIEFDANVAGTYRITIPGNSTAPTPYYDRVLAGATVFGTNKVFWDGKTGVNGDPLTAAGAIPPGSDIGSVTVQLKGAEVHFPFLDMEMNANGIKIIQLGKSDYSIPATGSDEVYWNDSNLPAATTGQTASSPDSTKLGSTGISSRTGNRVGVSTNKGNGHSYGKDGAASPTTEYGNTQAMDTYSFVPGPEVTQPLAIHIKEADVSVTALTSNKTAGTIVNVGDSWTYPTTVKNGGPDFASAKFMFYVPKGVTIDPSQVNVTSTTGTVTVQTATAAFTVGTGTLTGGTYSVVMDMSSGSTVSFSIPVKATGGITSGNGDVNVYSTILRPADITDPDATNTTSVAPTDPFFEADGVHIAATDNIFTNATTISTITGAINSTNAIVAGRSNNIRYNNDVKMYADVEVVKTTKQTNSGTGVAAFTITVTNHGASTATNVVMLDDLSTRYTYTAANATAGAVVYSTPGTAGGIVTWTNTVACFRCNCNTYL